MKQKHFENLWEEAESIESDNIDSVLNELLLKCNLLASLKDEESFNLLYGEILFVLAKISKIKNINVYKELFKTIKAKKDN